MSDTTNLTKLGSQKTEYVFDKPRPELLETFENQHQDNLYVIPIECFEGTSLCPKTHQPDMFTLYVSYIPDKKCVESKSMKLFIFSFRNTGSFMEDITNYIAKELVTLLDPWYIEVYGDFNSRGGIFLRPFVQMFKEGISDAKRNELRNVMQDYSRFTAKK